MYTRDVITSVHEFVGAGTFEFVPTGDRYIVGIHIQQSGVASDTVVKCGDTTVGRNYGKDTSSLVLNYHCIDRIHADKTGNDSAFVTISYIPSNQYSNQLIASVSGQLNMAPSTAEALGGMAYIMWIGFAIVILIQAITLGTWLYRK